MRAKDIAFLADVLDCEREHAEPDEVVGLLAASGAIRASIVERQPEADVSALAAVEDALAARLYAPPERSALPTLPTGARPDDVVWVVGMCAPAELRANGWQETGSGAFWRRVTAEDVEGAARG